MAEMLSDLSTANLLTAIQANAYAYFLRRERMLGKAISEESGLTWIEAPASPPVAWLRDLVSCEDAPDQVHQAVVRFALRGLAEVYVVAVETGDCRTAWKSCGAVGIETEHVMICLLSGSPVVHTPVKGLKIERVSDDSGLRDCAAVISAGRDQWTAGFFQLTNPSLAAGHESLRYYLARIEGKPVATATQFFCAGLGGIWWVTTVPELRRRGVGTSITRIALADAASLGYRAVMVETLSDSVHTYRRLGFREYCKINVYRWKSTNERTP